MTARWDLGDPGFDVTSAQVHTAREDNWYVETTWGWAVLRYAEVSALLRDRRFRQGNARWPAQNGIHSGLFSDWWQETLLSLEGDDHARIRRLMVPAFKNRVIAELRPTFQAIANELIDGFAARGQVEFVHEFAEPYAARIICLLLGLPQDHWPQVARWADDLGASFSIDVGNQVPRIEAALTGLTGYVDDVVGDRRAHPRDDLVTTLVQARDAEGTLTDRELSVALVFLAFAGMETTRNQLGLALQTLLERPDQWALLAERPELGGNAVEEVMRVNPTVTWVTREALEDVEFQGLHIPKGGIVQMLSHSAGTDPRAVPDPSFDIAEQRPPHHGFGAGVHHCLGHFVARTDMAVRCPARAADARRDAECDGPGWLPVSGNTWCSCRFPIRVHAGDLESRCSRSPARPAPSAGGWPAHSPTTCATTSGWSCATPPGRRTSTPTCASATTPTTPPRSRPSTGVDTLFMVSAAEAVDRRDQHRSFIDAAARRRRRHIVYTSFAGAAPDCDLHPRPRPLRRRGSHPRPAWPTRCCATTSTSTSCPSSPTRTA